MVLTCALGGAGFISETFVCKNCDGRIEAKSLQFGTKGQPGHVQLPPSALSAIKMILKQLQWQLCQKGDRYQTKVICVQFSETSMCHFLPLLYWSVLVTA